MQGLLFDQDFWSVWLVVSNTGPLLWIARFESDTLFIVTIQIECYTIWPFLFRCLRRKFDWCLIFVARNCVNLVTAINFSHLVKFHCAFLIFKEHSKITLLPLSYFSSQVNILLERLRVQIGFNWSPVLLTYETMLLLQSLQWSISYFQWFIIIRNNFRWTSFHILVFFSLETELTLTLLFLWYTWFVHILDVHWILKWLLL